jgi:D-alanyl-D-alanine carboxypeptidase/D-alanyl-D-alanine-endopeptidase (penicillin-binding protein 4)
MLPIVLLLLLQPALQVEASAPTQGTASSGPSAAGVVAPASAASAAAVAGLQGELQRLIRSPGWRGDQWGVMVVSLDQGDTIFSYQPDYALAPASNLKLYTSAAALYYLGPSFRYSTYLLSDGAVSGGVLEGELILYGTGDPTLSDRFFRTQTSVWEFFADSLAAQGITEIRGDVVGDASYFGDHGAGEGWQESYMSASYAVLPSALTFNDNLVTLHIRPGEQSGWRPQIQLVPGGEGIALVNQATTAPAGGRTSILVTRAAYDGPIVVRGQIAQGAAGVWRSVPVADPARYSAAVLRETLERRGIRVNGGIRVVLDAKESPVTGRSVFAPAFDKQPPLRVLAIHQSPPLQEILSVLNKKSHNLFADVVLRTVGRVVTGEGTVAGGARAVHYLLECETGEEPPVLDMYDGSGLSILNRTTPRTTIRLLAYMADSPIGHAFWETLPEAGDAQGLKRMYRTRAEGNLRAKTGTIDHVSALSGYVQAANGERLAFSIMSNNVPSTWKAKRVEDAIGARIASFSRPAAPRGSVVAPQHAFSPGAGTPGAAAPDSAGATGVMLQRTSAPVPSAPASKYHLIRSGDTLEGIAKRYGTTVASLQRANPGIDARRLLPGRRLLLP